MTPPSTLRSAVTAQGKAQRGGKKTAAPAYTQRTLPDGTTVIAAPMGLPAGWSRGTVTVEFILPIPYPSAPPDCFYTEADLRLTGGAMPMNTGEQLLEGQSRLWFSWHVTSWNPSVDNIHTYLRFIESRFRDAR